MRSGVMRISRKAWYAAGGLANPALFRKQRGHAWIYYMAIDYNRLAA